MIIPAEARESLIIDRQTNEITVEKDPKINSSIYERREFCGVLGTITLLAGNYLIIATHRELVGFIAGHSIWRLAGTKLIPYSTSTSHLNDNQRNDNCVYLCMIKRVLKTPNIYFSYSYDITHTMQRLQNTDPLFTSQGLYNRADGRFVWNGNLLKGFSQPEMIHFALPIIQGFIAINQCVVNGHSFSWSIVSRRSVFRAGTRLFTRGVDRDGNVANFVETEQIVEYQGDKASFVQVSYISLPTYVIRLSKI